MSIREPGTIDVPFGLPDAQLGEKCGSTAMNTCTMQGLKRETVLFARKFFVVVAIFVGASTARAQHGGPQPVRTVPREAAQFNFLVGQWDLEVKPAATTFAQKIHGTPKLVGTWKAWRALDGFGVEDESRITDRSGNPMSLSHAIRYYDANAKKWRTSSIDVYRGVFSSSVAEWRGTEMVASSQGTDGDGKPYLSRGTYSNITPSSFRFTQERSTDNGKTWSLNLTIDAKRASASASR